MTLFRKWLNEENNDPWQADLAPSPRAGPKSLIFRSNKMTEPPILTRHRQPIGETESDTGTYESLEPKPEIIPNKGSERNKEVERAKKRGSAWETEFGVPDKVGF